MDVYLSCQYIGINLDLNFSHQPEFLAQKAKAFGKPKCTCYAILLGLNSQRLRIGSKNQRPSCRASPPFSPKYTKYSLIIEAIYNILRLHPYSLDL